MPTVRIEFTEDKLNQWAGMGDFELVSPDGKHVVELVYEGEPPHGDSYLKATLTLKRVATPCCQALSTRHLFIWPSLVGKVEPSRRESYTFKQTDKWLAY